MSTRGRTWSAAGATLAAAGLLAGVGVAGAAQDTTIVAVGDASEGQWDLRNVAISTGDTVTWRFGGASHNVASTNANDRDPRWEPFVRPGPGEFDVAPVGASYDFTFYKSGTYDFVCRLHPVMTGTIEVTGTDMEIPSGTPTPTPTPSPSPSPSPSPQPQPSPGEEELTTPAPGSGSVDRTRPRLAALRLKALRRGTRVSFRLSEAATVTVNVKRRGSRTVVRRARVQMRPGRRAIVVRNSKLRRGRYTVELRARDAMGNRSALKRAGLRIRRR